MVVFLKNLRTYFREYCTNTSIHGFRYLGEARTIFERIWWGIVLMVCLTLCTFSIYTVYTKWAESPVVITSANKVTPIYEIPFPAVTICPVSKSQAEKFHFTKTHHNLRNGKNISETEKLHFDYMSMVCYQKLRENFDFTSYSKEFYDFLYEIKPDFIPLNCYNGRRYWWNCLHIFTPIFTEEGICYSYNLLDRSEMFRENVVHYRDFQQFQNKSFNWSIDHGYSEDAGLVTYPRRALLPGPKEGFSVKITAKEMNLDYLCSADSGQGYKVSVHSPANFPRPTQKYFLVPLNKKIVVGVSPSMTTTSEFLKTYSKDRRKCYFQEERHLKFFKIYNVQNCELECLTNFTLEFCGCVRFFMPRDNETDVCGRKKAECISKAERKLQLKSLEEKIEKKKSEESLMCDCLPLCTDLDYNTEISHYVDDFKNYWDEFFNTSMLKIKIYESGVTIYFKTDTFVKYERHEFYGPIDFLANFGGILGLFTGISVLSVMEILYFSTVRVLCNRRLYGRWAGQRA